MSYFSKNLRESQIITYKNTTGCSVNFENNRRLPRNKISIFFKETDIVMFNKIACDNFKEEASFERNCSVLPPFGSNKEVFIEKPVLKVSD